MSEKNIIFDRESGKAITIQYPSLDLRISNSPVSFRANWDHLPVSQLIALLKCLLILQYLPQSALEEAADELERVADFYSNRSPQSSVSSIPASSVNGRLRSAHVRPPIVLES